MTDKQIEALYDLVEGRIDEVNTFYLGKVAQQLRDIGELSQSRVNMLVQMRRMGMSVKEINRKLERMTSLNAADIHAAYERAARDAYTDAEFMYLAKGAEPVAFTENAMLQSAVKAIARQTAETMINYSNTTNISRAYKTAVTNAIQAVTGGVIDYNTAIRDTLRRTACGGLRVEYESGRTMRLDSAVRQNVIDGVRQVNQQAAIIMGEQIGADGYELSAHPNSAPDHEPVQGRVFDKANYELMQAGEVFVDADGKQFKGFDRPIAEWNCKHFASPFLLGVSKRRYTDAQLDDWREKNNKGCTIGGRHYTNYEAGQKMRELETAIRQQKDIANAARITGDDRLRREAQGKISNLRAQYDVMAKASGLPKQLDRTHVDGFRSVRTVEEMKGTQEYAKLKTEQKLDWLQRGYDRAVKAGDISALTGFDLYESVASRVEQDLVGQKACDGVDITGYKTHFIDRLIGSYSKKREPVSMESVKQTVFGNPVISDRKRGNVTSRSYESDDCICTINPETGTLIQTTPKKKG